jgi:hypothetical protein
MFFFEANAMNHRILLQSVACLGLLAATYAPTLWNDEIQGRVIVAAENHLILSAAGEELYFYAPSGATVTLNGKPTPLSSLKSCHWAAVAAHRESNCWVAERIEAGSEWR